MIDATKRVQLAELLSEAAELEHGVLCMQLYAAFSFKRRVDEGVSWAQLELMRRWEASIMVVARQEMEHLGYVNNILTAIGEPPYLGRPNFPLPAKHYTLNVPFKLERFNLASLLRLTVLEQAGDEQQPPPHTIYQLYEDISTLINDLGEDLFIGPPSAQLGNPQIIPVPLRGMQLPPNKSFYDFLLEPVTNVASAQAAITQITEEGEGMPTLPPVGLSHYQRFKDIESELVAEQQKDPRFDPARPVIDDCTAEGIPDKYAPTKSAAQLFDLAYETLMLMLWRFFAHSDESQDELSGLQRAAFFPMMTTIIRPLGEVLTELPVGTGTPAPTAGPAFHTARSVSLLPHREAAWRVIEAQLLAIAAGAQTLSTESTFTPAIKARFELMYENAAKMAAHFAAAMNLPEPS